MTGYTFNQLFDFTRTTSATFVGSNGLIQTTPASVNLLTYTQDFDNAAWVKSATTAAANTTVAPDGTSTADTLTATATTAAHYTQQNVTVVSGQSYAVSVYAKMGTHRYIQFAAGADSPVVNFDLESGVVGTTTSVTSSSITPVGNGWYRCVMVYTATVTSTSLVISEVPSASSARIPSWTAAGTETVYLWGAQIEAGTTATTYTRNNGGRFPARFDYDPVTLAPKGILIEEQRTNLMLRSETFDNATWSKSQSTVTANVTTAPDGTTTADKLVEDSTTNIHQIIQNAASGIGSVETFSVFAKQAERQWVVLQLGSGASSYFNLATGTIGTTVGATATITNFGNGWYRCSISGTRVASNNNFILLATSDTVTTYLGNGTSGLYLWGAQMEAGAFATSYIPTVASQVTRSADVCTIVAPMFAPWYNQSAGTFVFGGDSAYGAGGMIGSTPTSGAILYSSSFDAKTFNGTTGITSAAPTYTANTPFKATMAYSSAGRAIALNGGAVNTDANLIQTPTAIALGNAFGSSYLNGHIRSIKFYPFRASNNQLQVLST